MEIWEDEGGYVPSLPPSYHGCSCDCHTSEYVKHFAPCCYPDSDYQAEQIKGRDDV